MQYQDTTSFEKIEAMDARLNIIQGGARAGKTIAILMTICDLTMPFSGLRDQVIHIVSDTLPNLRHGAMYDWERMLKGTGRAPYFTVNKTEHKWTNVLTGTSVEFLSCDAEDALGAPRDFLFVNEANRISRAVFDQLILRTTERIWVDFNPVNEFWVHDLMKERTDWQFLKLTYLDNEAIPEPILNELLQHKGDGTNNFWRVYGLGEIGSLEGNVYEGWTPVDKIPDGFVLKRYGVDFGFNDPTVIEGVYEGEYDGTPDAILAKTEVYQSKLTAPEIVAKCKALPNWQGTLFVCDNARPEVIAEMKRAGIRAVGSNKTPGEKMNGKRYNIDLVQRRKVLYLSGDKELEREYLTYAWRKKKSGETLDEPEDGNDHAMDALAYAVRDMQRKPFIYGEVR